MREISRYRERGRGREGVNGRRMDKWERGMAGEGGARLLRRKGMKEI